MSLAPADDVGMARRHPPPEKIEILGGYVGSHLSVGASTATRYRIVDVESPAWALEPAAARTSRIPERNYLTLRAARLAE